MEFNIDRVKPITRQGRIPPDDTTVCTRADPQSPVRSDSDSIRERSGTQAEENASIASLSLEDIVRKTLTAARAETASEVQRLCKIEVSASATNLEERLLVCEYSLSNTAGRR